MAIWDTAANGWDRWRDLLQRQYGEATERLFDLASIKPGSRVMDVAAGPGYQTVQVAARVGPDGFVLASDISPEMVRIAERNVREAGYINAEFQVMDATALSVPPETFDAVICRQGVMTFPEPYKAVRSINTALRQGGTVGVTVFAAADRNPYLSVPAEIISRHLALPPDTPIKLDVFRFGEIDALSDLLSSAGFEQINIERFSTPMILENVDQYVAHLRESSRVLLELMRDADEKTASAIWAETATAANQFMNADGFNAPGEILITSGVKH